MPIRKARQEDAARIAYLIMVWDRELPGFVRTVNGDHQAALQAAELMVGPYYETWVAEEDGEVVGAICVNNSVCLFGFRSYGDVAGVYVLPKYRGGRLLGLKLIRKAMALKAEMGWRWLAINPWADDVNTGKVLERLGFTETLHTYVLR